MNADPEDAATPLLAGIAAVTGSCAAAGSTPRFVAAPVSAGVVSLTPAVVVRYAILLLGKAGEHLGFALAPAVTVGIFAGVAVLGRRFGSGEYLGAPLSGAWTAGLGWFVAAVEVSTDGGATWREAELSESLSDADVWRQWTYEWSPDPGSHEVVVGAVDGEGRVQVRDEHAAFHSGTPPSTAARRGGSRRPATCERVPPDAPLQ